MSEGSWVIATKAQASFATWSQHKREGQPSASVALQLQPLKHVLGRTRSTNNAAVVDLILL